MVLLSFEPDFISLNETHLTGSDVIAIEGYTWFGHNRKTHIRAPRGSGGVGILVKNKIFSSYSVRVIDKSMDGLIGLELKNLITEYCFIIFSCYLPPEGSVWADPNGLFNQLLVQVYNLSEADAVYMCGDLNSRMGHLEDCINDIDIDVPPRVSLDNVVNKQGEMLVELLKDSKCCILNGRIPGKNNYTSISVKGSAVVDYLITPHHCLSTCIDLNIHSPSELIERGGTRCFNLLGDRCRAPDHALLALTFHAGGRPVTDIGPITDHYRQYSPKNIRNASPHLFSSSRCKTAFTQFTGRLFQVHDQKEIDEWYDEFCEYVYNVPEVCTRSIPGRKSRYARKPKPYWNEKLKILWKEMRAAERSFLRCDSQDMKVKQQFKNEFKMKQQIFDKKLRACKRNYERGQALKIECTQTSNPQMFWSLINNLGPRKIQNIPMEVLSEDGSSVFVTDFILKKWETDFGSLFSGNDCPLEWDNSFLAEKITQKNIMESHMQQESYSVNQ